MKKFFLLILIFSLIAVSVNALTISQTQSSVASNQGIRNNWNGTNAQWYGQTFIIPTSDSSNVSLNGITLVLNENVACTGTVGVNVTRTNGAVGNMSKTQLALALMDCSIINNSIKNVTFAFNGTSIYSNEQLMFGFYDYQGTATDNSILIYGETTNLYANGTCVAKIDGESNQRSNCQTGITPGGDLAFVIDYTEVVNNFSITSKDIYNLSTINNFSAIILLNGTNTTYTTTTGTINTNITPTSDLVNITIFNATNYFSTSFTNINVNSNLIANLSPYTAIYSRSLVDGNISILNFKLNVTNSSGTTTLTTTTGIIYVPLFNDTWSFVLFDAFNSTYNFTSDTANLTGNPYLQNYTFYLYASNTFNIIFRNELTNAIITTPAGNSSLIQVELIGDLFSYNYTANGTLTASLLIPQSYIIRYSKDGYGRLRQYFVTLTNQTIQNLTLYMIEDSESTSLTVTVYDQTTLVRVPGTVVYLQRFNVTTNSYNTVAMYETDVAGNAYFDVQENDELYKFQVDYPWQTTVFTSEPFYIESTEINLYIQTIPGFSDEFFEQVGITGQITFTPTPNTFTLNYNDPSSTASQYCFSVKKWNRYAKEVINQSCSSSASGSISLNGFTDDGTYYGVFTATIDGSETVIAASWKDIVTDELGAGAFGIFLTLGIFLTALFLFPWHTFAAIIGTVALMFAKLFGIFPIDWGYIIALFIAAILLGAFLDNRR